MSTRREEKSAIIVSASSDIGAALTRRWRERGWSVAGTYRTESAAVAELRAIDVKMVMCDLAQPRAARRAAESLRSSAEGWDVLVLAAGELGPVGPFAENDYESWESSLRVNLLAQLEFVHALLPQRRKNADDPPTVLFFAGGGTNGAPANFSAYTLSKIALIKICELLDAEMPDVKFVILGPGWVRTKIHETVLSAGELAGRAYDQTVERLQSGNFTSMDQVLNCCDWAVAAPRAAVSGRNFSVTHDSWHRPRFVERLAADPDMCKLRRHGNEFVAVE